MIPFGLPARARPRVGRALAVSAVLASALTTVATTTADASVQPLPGWSQVFADDFDGPAGSPPSSSNWQFDLGYGYPGGGAGNWGTGEIEEATNNPANVGLDGGGNLRITPPHDGATGWTSARIESRRTDFKPPDGGVLRIEARIQLPDVTGAAAEGYWPAIWALGSPFRGNYQNWPGIGEFDVMENVNGLDAVHLIALHHRAAGDLMEWRSAADPLGNIDTGKGERLDAIVRFSRRRAASFSATTTLRYASPTETST